MKLALDTFLCDKQYEYMYQYQEDLGIFFPHAQITVKKIWSLLLFDGLSIDWLLTHPTLLMVYVSDMYVPSEKENIKDEAEVRSGIFVIWFCPDTTHPPTR